MAYVAVDADEVSTNTSPIQAMCDYPARSIWRRAQTTLNSNVGSGSTKPKRYPLTLVYSIPWCDRRWSTARDPQH